METRDVVITQYARTPFTKANKGKFKDTRPDTLAAESIKAVMAQADGLEPDDIDDVVIGCAMPEGEQGMNVARQASILAGLPEEVPAITVNRFCSSGVQTISQAAERIMLGENDIAIAGGTESMTMVPIGGNKASANPKLMEEHPEVYVSMGTTAENVARKFDIGRERQDEFAVKSHEKATEARERGFFEGEIVPIETEVVDEDGNKQTITVTDDENIRPGTSMEILSKLPLAFDQKAGTVTPGNASPLTDGAAATIVMSAEKAEELGFEPMGYYRGFQVAGVPPEIMGIGPVPATRKLLDSQDMTMDQIDMVELNEAFASQASYCQEELEIPDDKFNVNGGAIALGHPLGVSGTRMAGTMLRALDEQGGKYGVVTMCIGGGMGAAALFEKA
jgi:acetyl-CoA acyltransferase